MAKPLSWETEAPLVIGHRGASSLAPENTHSAFRLALESGADGLEFDVKLSADGVAVVHHDRTLERTTNGSGLLSKQTLAALEALDAGSSFDASFSGEKIPTLESVFEAFGGKTLLNIELTNYGAILDDLVAVVTTQVSAYALEDTVLLSSFSPLALIQAEKRSPCVRRALLLPSRSPRIYQAIAVNALRVDDIHPAAALVSQDFVNRQRSRGRLVRAWTVNDPGEMIAFFRIGVHAVITDDPGAASGARSQFLEERR
jgi:glycerophosphoryl diester phosphodiesterase